ncbi:MAG: amidohydrolase family protein [Chloroflexi bacterium]|jgi:predicted TIM-barrel fold metal-dependent hydrolase|nr:amidohydrolase family protein [Chloroflexota bacterium]MBT7081200.1 amidohydrolase family protein [Chloroflexota bacterium]MBT7290255.1 amidohydrolase family protein [Chloroflexota bacterium]
MIIDVENHIRIPAHAGDITFESGKATERFWKEDGSFGFRLSKDSANVGRYIQFMDEAGIDMAVLTSQTPALVDLDETKKWHDYAAELMQKYPKRLACIATIKPVGVKGMLKELERAIKECGLKGVHISASNNNVELDSKEMWPFYELVSQLNIPVDVHIQADTLGFENLKADYALHYVAAREFHMASAVMRVCFGGVLEQFPDLKLLMNHFGGGISSVIDRFDLYAKLADDLDGPGFYHGEPLISRPFREYFDKLYFNMAGRGASIATIKCALTNICPKKLLFATDWPLNYDYYPDVLKKYIEDIRKLDLPADDIEAMLGGNAAQFYGL